MRGTTGLLEWVCAMAVAVALLTATAVWAQDSEAKEAQVIVSFDPGGGPATVTRDAAIRLATGYTGLAAESIVSLEHGLATDTSIPFFHVVARPAWQVVFDPVELSLTTTDGTKRSNPNINRMAVLLDSETGALLKVSSPTPAEGGLTEQPGGEVDRGFAHYPVLRSSPTKPGMPLMQALRLVEPALPGALADAKHVVAYFGLLTDTLRLKNGIKDRPYWMIFLGGISEPVVGGPPGQPPVAPATEALVVLDADAGTCYLVHLIARGD
jgi:hypothetical protein